MASARPGRETGSSATGTGTASGSQLPRSRPSTWLGPTYFRPHIPAKRWRLPRPGPALSRPCPVPALAPPATLLVTLHWQWWAAMPRPERGPRSPSREGKGVGLGQLSTGNVSLRHSFSPHRPHAQCLGIQRFGLGKRHYTVCIYGTHLPLDAIIPWSKLQKRVAAQVCCSPFSQALGSSL